MYCIWKGRRREVERLLSEGKTSTELADHYGCSLAARWLRFEGFAVSGNCQYPSAKGYLAPAVTITT